MISSENNVAKVVEMTKKAWQVYFTVSGLVAPKDGMSFDDALLIIGTKERDDVSEVFFKVSPEGDEPSNQESKNIREKLRLLLQTYGLVSGRHAGMPDSTSSTTVEPGQPLGKPQIRSKTSISLHVRKEQWEKYTSFLKISVAKSRELERLLEDRKKRFLLNAIDYYYRALGDETLEEKLIDLFVSLESMLSSYSQELRLRLSLRICLLLGRSEKEKRQIFDVVYDLYKERGSIVHRGEPKDTNREDISKLRAYVKRVFTCLIYVELSKDEIIELIDKSLYDTEKEQELIRLTKASKEKWDKVN